MNVSDPKHVLELLSKVTTDYSNCTIPEDFKFIELELSDSVRLEVSRFVSALHELLEDREKAINSGLSVLSIATVLQLLTERKINAECLQIKYVLHAKKAFLVYLFEKEHFINMFLLLEACL